MTCCCGCAALRRGRELGLWSRTGSLATGWHAKHAARADSPVHRYSPILCVVPTPTHASRKCYTLATWRQTRTPPQARVECRRGTAFTCVPLQVRGAGPSLAIAPRTRAQSLAWIPASPTRPSHRRDPPRPPLQNPRLDSPPAIPWPWRRAACAAGAPPCETETAADSRRKRDARPERAATSWRSFRCRR
eukprot:scaffold3142_cov101-Isochrysis_galbana.AAC.1